MERILQGYACQRRSSLRVNCLKTNMQQIQSLLSEAGITTEKVSWYDDAVTFPQEEEGRLREMSLYKEGMIYLQNLSSMLPPLALQPHPAENILDMAAAPGGKTTMIAMLTENKAMITACEPNAGRAEKLRYNLMRQGASRVTVMQCDARKLDDLFKFDRILLDAPCSGSGTVNAGFRGRFNENNLKKTTSLQEALLRKAISMLSSKHEMVYSTCSILREENEAILEPFIRRGIIEVIPPELNTGDIPKLPTAIKDTLCVCPDERYEGFFMARLRKK